jgi:hypothetical protein
MPRLGEIKWGKDKDATGFKRFERVTVIRNDNPPKPIGIKKKWVEYP